MIHFCEACGETLYAAVDPGGLLAVSVTKLENAADYRPEMAIFTASAPEWATLPTDIPCHERMPSR